MKRILIVDDNPDICAVLGRRLKAEGFNVQCVTNGLSFLSKLRSEDEPEALILDLVLPERTGVELLYTLRSKWKNVKVFIYSGHDKYKEEITLEEYISGFFLKGEGTERLIDAIKEAVPFD